MWLAVAATATFWGLDYYVLPFDERAFSPLAPIFSPTGTVGHGYGVVGATMIALGVVGYMARKRIGFLARAGSLRHWLQVHIFLCTLGPFLVLLHTTFKFGGLVSVAFWSMALVVASGVFGRFIYVRIPKTLNGRFLGLDTLGRRIDEVTERLRGHSRLSQHAVRAFQAATTPPPATPGLTGALLLATGEGVRHRVRLLALRRVLVREGMPRPLRLRLLRLASEQRRLRQQILLLAPFQRLFRYWHVVHLPLTIVLAVILGVHIVVSVLFGYTWIF